MIYPKAPLKCPTCFDLNFVTKTASSLTAVNMYPLSAEFVFEYFVLTTDVMEVFNHAEVAPLGRVSVKFYKHHLQITNKTCLIIYVMINKDMRS